jgi:8-hydroxy-5-deazaflavin:NADPH oxidoreductase
MKVAVVGRGNVGGGLADLWESGGAAGRVRLQRGVHQVASNAEFIKSKTGGPTAKSFNLNFAAIYDRIPEARAKPGNIWCGDEEAREPVEQLVRDAGFEPLYAGPLENAAAQESFLKLMFAINQSGVGPFFYRMAPPAEL